MGMEPENGEHTSQLFLVRLWADERANGGGRGCGDGPEPDEKVSVHGKVQHVVSGEAAPFSNWQTLVEALSKMMPHQVHVDSGDAFGAKGANDNEHNT